MVERLRFWADRAGRGRGVSRKRSWEKVWSGALSEGRVRSPGEGPGGGDLQIGLCLLRSPGGEGLGGTSHSSSSALHIGPPDAWKTAASGHEPLPEVMVYLGGAGRKKPSTFHRWNQSLSQGREFKPGFSDRDSVVHTVAVSDPTLHNTSTHTPP